MLGNVSLSLEYKGYGESVSYNEKSEEINAAPGNGAWDRIYEGLQS